MDGLPDALAVESQSIRQLPPCPVPAHPKVRLPGASSPAKPTSTPSLTGKLADCLTDKPTAKLTAKLADKQPSDLEQRDGITALAATTEPSPSQQAPATFQSLPREIRHEIYKLVLADHMHKTLIYGLPLQHRTRLYSALALTSWQTRRETLAIMYAYNTWTIKLEYAVFYREFVGVRGAAGEATFEVDLGEKFEGGKVTLAGGARGARAWLWSKVLLEKLTRGLWAKKAAGTLGAEDVEEAMTEFMTRHRRSARATAGRAEDWH